MQRYINLYIFIIGGVLASLNVTKSLYLWGNNDFGQIGNGARGKSNWTSKPELVDALKTKNMVHTISLGSEVSTALTNEGQLFVWGNGENGYVMNAYLHSTANTILLFVIVIDNLEWEIRRSKLVGLI